MKYYIVIPAHNEEAFMALTLQSLIEQTVLPTKAVIVNDNSTDKTAEIFTGTVAQARELKNITELCNLCKTRAEKAGKLPEEATSDAIQEGVEKVKDLVEQ